MIGKPYSSTSTSSFNGLLHSLSYLVFFLFKRGGCFLSPLKRSPGRISVPSSRPSTRNDFLPSAASRILIRVSFRSPTAAPEGESPRGLPRTSRSSSVSSCRLSSTSVRTQGCLVSPATVGTAGQSQPGGPKDAPAARIEARGGEGVAFSLLHPQCAGQRQACHGPSVSIC